MSLNRTDLNKAGWLYKHPDVQSGFPESWLQRHTEVYGALGVALHLDDAGGSDDELTHLNANIEPMMAFDVSMISHLLVQGPIEGELCGIWLLFAENHFIGLVEYHNAEAVYVELVQASIWEKIAHQSGYSHVKANQINSYVPYDPKIMLTAEQADWANSQSGIYDPYL